MSDALALRAELDVTGAPMRLVDVLARARDPRSRLAAIDAYWNVALSWIAAHWQWSDHDFLRRLEAMSPSPTDDVEGKARETQFRARLAAASADWRQAELDVTEAQQRLAAIVRLTPNEALPLAADLPHVGAYKTRFESLYAGQPAPERPLVIHHTLPLRERELRLRAEAILTARDALEAAEAGYQEGSVSLNAVLSCLDDQASERGAFLAVVRKYNLDIAEYALATPLPVADDRVLAARLIKLRPEDGWRWEPRNPANPSAAIDGPEAPIAVTLPPGEGAQPAGHQARQDLPGRAQQLRYESGAPRRSPAKAPPAASPDQINPPPVHDGAQKSGSSLEEISRLADLSSDLQVAQINSRLDVAGGTPSQGLPLALGDCLRRAAAQSRRDALIAFWHVSESLAQRAAFAQAIVELDELRPRLLGLHADPTGTLAMLRCRTADLDHRASLAAVDAVLLEQRARLTVLAGQPLTSAWAWPTTAAHLSRDHGSDGMTPAALRKRQAYALLGDRAQLLIATASAQTTAKAAAPHDPVAAMQAVESTTAATMAAVDFLASVTRYNLAATDQVLSTLPARSSAERIMEALGYEMRPQS